MRRPGGGQQESKKEPTPPEGFSLTYKPVIASPKGAAICSDRRVALLLAMTGYVTSLPAEAVTTMVVGKA
jgi:hypothetical protein